MDRQKINKLLVDVINEDAVSFKNYLSEVLYQKVNRRLQEEYKNISKTLFEMNSTTLSTGPEAQEISMDQVSGNTEITRDPDNYVNATGKPPNWKEIREKIGAPGYREWEEWSDERKRQFWNDYIKWWMKWYEYYLQQGIKPAQMPKWIETHEPRWYFQNNGWENPDSEDGSWPQI